MLPTAVPAPRVVARSPPPVEVAPTAGAAAGGLTSGLFGRVSLAPRPVSAITVAVAAKIRRRPRCGLAAFAGAEVARAGVLTATGLGMVLTEFAD